jgi:hypothetical protein
MGTDHPQMVVTQHGAAVVRSPKLSQHERF